MRLEHQILIAVGIDLLLGDPQWLPHPVRAIGTLAARLEDVSRRLFRSARLAGAACTLAVYAATGLAAWGLLAVAWMIHPAVGDAAAILIIYAAIAPRDLMRHSMAVFRPLSRGDLAEARRCVGWICGRDTDRLDAPGVARAAVESVAESTVDGVTAPLFFALLAGPIGAIVYRAVNTLDSMFGHRDERYAEFGYCAAKIDDLANYVPARLTAPLMCLAAMLLGQRGAAAVQILRRDGRKHASPNSGLAEAAMAGALGVQLGGTTWYDGQPLDKPTIGEPHQPCAAAHIAQANWLMLATTLLFLACGVALRYACVEAALSWRVYG